MAVAAARGRAHGDEHDLGLTHRMGEVGVELQPARSDVAAYQVVEARLEDRHLAGLEALDLGGVLVDAGDLVAEVGEAGAGDQADIARTDHRNAHGALSIQAPGCDRRDRARASPPL